MSVMNLNVVSWDVAAIVVRPSAVSPRHALDSGSLSSVIALRGTSHSWSAAVDRLMVEELGGLLANIVGCRNPQLAGQTMAANFRRPICNRTDGTSTPRHAAAGWCAAVWFLGVACRCAELGVVAGSAALYLEQLATCGPDNAPEWRPFDVDCWVNDCEAAEHVVRTIAVSTPFAGRITTKINEYINVTSIDNMNLNFVRCGIKEHAEGARMCEVPLHGGNTTLQVIWQTTCSYEPKHCACVWPTGCFICMSRATELADYSDTWPLGLPQLRFDLDGPCVGFEMVDNVMKFTRTAGEPRGTLRVRPQAIWCLFRENSNTGPTPQARTEIDHRLLARARKYSHRGYSTLLVPRVCVVNDCELLTPDWLLDALLALNSGTFEVRLC
jgi:hypothetical protein